MTQKALQRENEIAEVEAEAKKKIAEAKGIAESILIEAKAQAQANTILSQSITPQYIEYLKITKWDGKLPLATGTVPFMNINK